MAKTTPAEIQARFQCHSTSKQRGGTENVTLVPVPGARENAQFFKGHPSGSISLVIDNPDGQGLFDPEMDYLVTLTPVEPAK